MSDTQRDLAALLALFADNTAGGISEQDARDFMVSAFGGYASAYVDAGSSSQVATTGGIAFGLLSALGPASGVTIATGTGQMTFSVAGDYMVDGRFEFDGVAGRLYTFNAGTGLVGSALVNAAAERATAGFGNIITVTAGQSRQLKAFCDVNNLLTLRSGFWRARRVG
jgi:hypothetical protein